ncbi:MAG: LysM peptidoglycan-binding domain-containing protein [Epsilonproteobacteria bacterium]|nr:LysM peptidoglycan-binding domain-containing protein [Campylobacterota bacterium]
MDTLSRLSTELEELMEGIDNKDSYTQSISEEIEVRSNEMRIIIVKRGDTLSNIAKRAYGDYDAYPKIFAANPEVIQNPDQIFVGQRLRIPL